MKDDRLSYIFETQAKIQKKIFDIDLPQELPDMIPYYTVGLVSEIGEVLQADKRWKHKTGGDNAYHNEVETKAEILDCFLYLINLAMAVGMDVDEFFKYYEFTQQKVRERNGMEYGVYMEEKNG